MRYAPSFAAAAALALLAGWVREPEPPRAAAQPIPVAPRAPAAVPTPTGSDWRDWPVTPGDWAYRVDARGSIALFGTPGENAVLTLRCDTQTNAVYLSRQGSAATPLTLRTTSATRVLTMQSTGRPTGADTAYVAVALAPRDPLLDAMAFSRGRFVIEQSGAATLVVPAWAEVARVTEDCRR